MASASAMCRLTEEIGRGGMVSVYLPERDGDQFRKQVAIN